MPGAGHKRRCAGLESTKSTIQAPESGLQPLPRRGSDRRSPFDGFKMLQFLGRSWLMEMLSASQLQSLASHGFEMWLKHAANVFRNMNLRPESPHEKRRCQVLRAHVSCLACQEGFTAGASLVQLPGPGAERASCQLLGPVN